MSFYIEGELVDDATGEAYLQRLGVSPSADLDKISITIRPMSGLRQTQVGPALEMRRIVDRRGGPELFGHEFRRMADDLQRGLFNGFDKAAEEPASPAEVAP